MTADGLTDLAVKLLRLLLIAQWTVGALLAPRSAIPALIAAIAVGVVSVWGLERWPSLARRSAALSPAPIRPTRPGRRPWGRGASRGAAV